LRRGAFLRRASFLLASLVAAGCAGRVASSSPTGGASEGSSTPTPGPTPTPTTTPAPLDAGAPDTGTPTAGQCALSVDSGGGTLSTILVDGFCVPGVGPMLVDDTSIVMVDDEHGAIRHIDRATGAQSVLAGDGVGPSVLWVIADGGDEIFFVGCDGGSRTCSIDAVPRTGGPSRTVTSLDTGASVPSIAVGANDVYYVADASILRVPRAGGTPTTIVAAPTNDQPGAVWGALALGDGALFATSPAYGTVTRLPLDGSAGTVIASNEARPGAIVASGATVRWLDVGQLGVDCTPGGGGVRLWQGGKLADVVTDVTGASGFAVADDGTVAVASEGSYCNTPTVSGTIESVTAGGSPVLLASQLLLAGNPVVAKHEVFWTVRSSWDGSGAIMHAPLP
jgi:hypothetical protein